MTENVFKVVAAQLGQVSEDWRKELIDLLGSKPRRLSPWCELGLWGALSCIAKTGQRSLSDAVAIRLYCELGTIATTRKALEQMQEGLPMPFTFIQTQPGQLFNALGITLGWHGDGLTTSYNEPRRGEASLLQGSHQAILLAWVEEQPLARSHWLYLEKAQQLAGARDWRPVASLFQIDANATWLKIDAEQHIFQAL